MGKTQIYETPKLGDDQRAELVRRAYVAWFKSGGTQMPTDRSSLKMRLGLAYVVLHGASGVLAVYRVRPHPIDRQHPASPVQHHVSQPQAHLQATAVGRHLCATAFEPRHVSTAH